MIANLPASVLAAAREAAPAPEQKPAPYDQAAARQADSKKQLPMEREGYKGMSSAILPELKRRQIVDDKGQVLAEARLISGGLTLFRGPGAPDLAVAVNDKALKITLEGGEMKVSGREGLKFVEVDLQNPEKKTPVADFVPKEDLAKVDGILLFTTTNDIVVAKGTPGRRIESMSGSANITVEAKDMNPDGKAPIPRISVLDRQATYNITVKNLPATVPNPDGNAQENQIRTRFANVPEGSVTAFSDAAGSVNITSTFTRATDVIFKDDNRKPVTLQISRDLDPVRATFEANPGDTQPSREAFRASLNKAVKASRTSEFEMLQLPANPFMEEARGR